MEEAAAHDSVPRALGAELWTCMTVLAFISAGDSTPHIHGLLVLWSLTLQAREPMGQGGGQIRAAPLLAMGQVQGLREQLLCGSHEPRHPGP